MAEETPSRRRHKTDPPPLSAREIRFCQLWVETGNATRSYIDAGLPHSSEHVARTMAFRKLRNVDIRTYIRELQKKAADSAQVTADELAHGFRRAELADVRKLVGPDGNMVPLQDLPDEIALAIQGIEVESVFEWEGRGEDRQRVEVGKKYKIKLENKTEARKILAQWLGMLKLDKDDKVEKFRTLASFQRSTQRTGITSPIRRRHRSPYSNSLIPPRETA